MIGGKCRAHLDVGEDARLQLLGARDALFPAGLAPGHAPREDHRVLCARKKFCCGPDEMRGRQDRLGCAKPLGIGKRRERPDFHFLQRGVEVDVSRAARRGVRDLRCAQQGLVRGADRARLVVPLGVVAYQGALVRGGVDPVDPGTAFSGVPGAGRAENQHRHAVAPGIEDPHGRVHQPDVGVHHRAHHPVGGLGVALRDRHRRLLVQAEQHLRPRVAEVVDEAVVQSAVARPRIQSEVRDG